MRRRKIDKRYHRIKAPCDETKSNRIPFQNPAIASTTQRHIKIVALLVSTLPVHLFVHQCVSLSLKSLPTHNILNAVSTHLKTQLQIFPECIFLASIHGSPNPFPGPHKHKNTKTATRQTDAASRHMWPQMCNGHGQQCLPHTEHFSVRSCKHSRHFNRCSQSHSTIYPQYTHTLNPSRNATLGDPPFSYSPNACAY